ncbi:MAG: SMC-Scp complex subunit ScpB, partial [Candidatus Firestonebacteria bacterium]|nr:SMC-Scp complex subunit ScpB [Candidatus Firestonebacteria bacterium]
ALLEDLDRREILQCLDELKAEYDTQGRAFHLAEIAEGYQLVTRVALAPWIRKLYRSRASNKLSRAALETMAIIAYRQPISKMEVEDIRGVSADGVLNSLLERKLIRVVGRKEVVGRPLLYGTTKEFLHYFGLKDLSDMPELKDLQDMLRQDEAGKNWELNPEGQLIARMKGQDGEDVSAEPEPAPDAPTGAAATPEFHMVEKAEVTMQPYQETQMAHHDGGTGQPLPAGHPALTDPALAGVTEDEILAVKRGPKEGYDDHWGDDEDLRDQHEDEDEDEDTLGGDLDDEDEDDEDDEDEDEDEDDAEDDDDEDDDEADEIDDTDLEDEEDDEDEEEDDDDEDGDDEDEDEEAEEEDEDDDDLDDIDDLGSPEDEKPKNNSGRRK